jgi:hypothetical protein
MQNPGIASHPGRFLKFNRIGDFGVRIGLWFTGCALGE